MKLTERAILSYCDENSDKVYIVELFTHSCVEKSSYEGHNPSTRQTLICSWGRRTAPRLSSQVKLADGLPAKVKREYNKVISQKLKNGYTEVLGMSRESFAIPGYNRNRNPNVTGIENTINSTVEIPRQLHVADDIRTII